MSIGSKAHCKKANRFYRLNCCCYSCCCRLVIIVTAATAATAVTPTEPKTFEMQYKANSN